MKITNRLGLPEAFVRAVENDPYDNHGTLSVTTLIRPPQMVRLLQKHKDEITEDASDRVWALLGQFGHSALERTVQDGDFVETRLYMDVDGKKVSGQLDRLTKDGVLVDWKFTSVYAIKDALRFGKSEWTQQLNMLVALVREDNKSERVELPGEIQKYYPEPKALRIIAVARDWRPSEKLQDRDYPNKVEVIKVPLWAHERAMEFIKERVRLHTLETPPPCTDEERWATDQKWAVMKKDGKKATKLFNDETSALKLIEKMKELEAKANEKRRKKKSVELSVVMRPRQYKRCEEYCSVSKFCPQFNGA